MPNKQTFRFTLSFISVVGVAQTQKAVLLFVVSVVLYKKTAQLLESDCFDFGFRLLVFVELFKYFGSFKTSESRFM
jgi:hypothetical protein